jgi:tetratricopeptide (TPR) repeat protein
MRSKLPLMPSTFCRPFCGWRARSVRVVLCFALLTSTFAFTADGKTLLEQGHYRQLYGMADARLNQNPRDAEALTWMSAIYDAWGDFDKAVAYGRRAADAAPDSSEAHCQLADTLGDKALKLGIVGGGVPLAHQMRHEIDRALELNPRNLRCLKESMGLYEQAPAVVGGNKGKAREALEQVKQINPAEGALAEAALLQMQKRPLAEIEAALRRAVQLNPRLYRALTELAGVLASDGYRRYGEAEQFARQAITADPNRAAAYTLLATVLARQQHWSELDAALAEAQRRVPDDASPAYNAAIVLLDSGVELPRAERYLRQYLAQEPEAGAPTRSTGHWKLALVLEKEGRLADAASELRAAAAGNANNPEFKRDYKRIAG